MAVLLLPGSVHAHVQMTSADGTVGKWGLIWDLGRLCSVWVCHMVLEGQFSSTFHFSSSASRVVMRTAVLSRRVWEHQLMNDFKMNGVLPTA